MPIPLVVLLLLLVACGRGGEDSSKPLESRLEPSAPAADERRPLPEGFTQRPPMDTPGLPPPAEPLFSETERAELEARALAVSAEARAEAQSELQALVVDFEKHGDERDLLARIRSRAAEHARQGRLSYRTAEALFREFLFPNDEKQAADRYSGRVVLLTGAVAPHNMVDLADGFKLVERTPYVHEPVLLATDYELSFVRCHLARRELQKLHDWQEVHLVGIVEGKLRGDLVLRRCIALPNSDP
jgi:hypothetical protein